MMEKSGGDGRASGLGGTDENRRRQAGDFSRIHSFRNTWFRKQGSRILLTARKWAPRHMMLWGSQMWVEWAEPHFELSCVLRDRYIDCISTLTEVEKWEIGANWTGTFNGSGEDYSDDCVYFFLDMKQCALHMCITKKERKRKDTVSGHLGVLPWSQA